MVSLYLVMLDCWYVACCWTCLCLFFFFKQKTAYEMRISDWSSDVCSSDLPTAHRLLKALTAEGLILQQPSTKRYQLGMLVSELGLAVQTTLDVRMLARETLERIASFTKDTVYLQIGRTSGRERGWPYG